MAAAESEKKTEERREDRDYWSERAYSVFGVKPYTLAAALADESRQNFTEGQIKDALRKLARHTVPANDGTPQAEAEEAEGS